MAGRNLFADSQIGESKPAGVNLFAAPVDENAPQTQPEIGQDLGQLDQVRLAMTQAIKENPAAATVAEFTDAINRGVINLADFFTADPINAALELTGSDARVPTFGEAGESVTQGGQMQPGLARDVVQTAGEFVAPGAAAGTALRTVAKAIPAVATASQQTLGQAITKQLGASTPVQDVTAAVLSGAGSEVGQEVGGAPGEAIGALVAPIAPATLKAAGSGLIKTIIRGSADDATKGIAKTIDDFAEIGEVPTVAQATGKEGLQGVENISGRIAGGGRITAKSRQVAESIQSRVNQIAKNISTVEGAESAGLVIKKGITGKGGFVDRFLGKSSTLWNKSDKLIDDALEVSVGNTKSKLDQLVREGKIGQILDNPKLVQIKEVLKDVDSIDYKTLRQLRSAIGQKLGNKELVTDIPRAELKQVYGALSEDIKLAAKNSGEGALKAFERANAFTRSGHNRLDDFVERITKKVEVNKIFDAVTKGGEGTKVISTFKKSLKPEEWEIVASNVIRRLGRASPGQQNAAGDAFSVDKFLTDWNKLGSARKTLLSGTKKLDEYRNSLNKIARVAERVKESAKSSANPSGTGQFVANASIAGGATGALAVGNIPIAAAILGTVAMNNAGARLMTNATFVKWLAANATSPTLTGAHIASLARIANASNLDDAAAIQSLIEEIE